MRYLIVPYARRAGSTTDRRLRASFRLSGRRAPRRRRGARPACGEDRHAVLLLFDGDPDAALPGVRRRFRRCARARLLRHEGQFQPGRDRDAGELGAGADVVSGGELQRALTAGIPPDKIMFSGIGKTEDELAAAIDAGILCVNVESEPELERLAAIAAAEEPPRRCFAARQSGYRCQDPRQDRDRQGGEQVRHPDQPRPRGLSPCRRAAGAACIGRRHAYRQPDHRTRTIRRCLRAALRFRAHAARRRPRHRARRPWGRAWHSLSARQGAAARPCRLCRGGQAGDARARLHADLRARAGSWSAMPASW